MKDRAVHGRHDRQPEYRALRATLQPYLQRRYVLPVVSAALIASLIPTFTPEYAPLWQSLDHRYAEDGSRAIAAAQATANAKTQAIAQQKEATASQAAAEQQRQQAAAGYDGEVSEYLRILHARRDPVMMMVQNLDAAIAATAKAAGDPAFYTTAGLQPEETTSALACTDPASTMDLLDREARRTHNIFACSIYLALNSQQIGEPQPQVTIALAERLSDASQDGYYPFQTIVAYVWLQHLTESVNEAQPPGNFPALNVGEDFNPALFRGTLSIGFIHRLIDTATTEEKIDLSRAIYPDLQRLDDLGNQIARDCQLMNRKPCLTSHA